MLRLLGYVRLFDAVIRRLLERGHRVHLLYERDVWTERERAWLDELDQHPGFTSGLSDAMRRDRWFRPASQLRRLADYVYYLGPNFRGVPSLVAKAEHRVDPRFRRLLRAPLLRTRASRAVLSRALAALEAAVPVSRTLEQELASEAPDVLVVVPHLMPGNRHSEYVRVARALGIPCCLCIASWDNLTSKQQLREIPDKVIVWNDVQRREAIELHGVPAADVVVTGVQAFDDWFDRQPRERDEFCALIGLDPARRYVLYLGGALFPGVRTEAEFVRDSWIPALRAEPGLDEVDVLVRPHPRRLEEWDSVALDHVERVVVWPRAGAGMPVDEESRADFFDSIYHSAAVVGLNTTAMIEASIVGRTVHTVLLPEFAESQTGTSHFAYLLSVGGGLLRVAASLEEHSAQLVETIDGRDEEAAERRRRFLLEFVRPRGLGVEALPLVVDAIESVAGLGRTKPTRGPLRLLPLRLVLTATLLSARGLAYAGRRFRR